MYHLNDMKLVRNNSCNSFYLTISMKSTIKILLMNTSLAYHANIHL